LNLRITDEWQRWTQEKKKGRGSQRGDRGAATKRKAATRRPGVRKLKKFLGLRLFFRRLFSRSGLRWRIAFGLIAGHAFFKTANALAKAAHQFGNLAATERISTTSPE
jgi:hypothetical protein